MTTLHSANAFVRFVKLWRGRQRTAATILAGLCLIIAAIGLIAVSASAQPPPSAFTAVGPMNTARYVHPQTLLPDGKILVLGESFPVAAEIFDPATNTFALLPSGSVTGRRFGTATTLPDTRILLAGGAGDDGLGTAELFDPSTLGSTPIAATMTSPRNGHCATLLPTDKVLISGGTNLSSSYNTVELFDLATETFTAVASNMSAPRYSHTATRLADGRVLLAGGFTGGPGGSATNTADIFDPLTENLLPIPAPMNSPRYGHTATLLPDGTVLLAGGWNATAALASAEIFDPATLTFTLVANAMTSPRQLHTATLLMNGRVLIAGGDQENQTPLNTAELFDPTGGTFSSLSPDVLTASRRAHAATLLPNGVVLLTGGYANGQPINTAEIFNCPPVLAHAAGIVVEATGPDGAIVDFSPPVGLDSAEQVLPIDCSPLPGAVFPLGTTTVICTTTDSSGATVTGTFNVIVTDSVAPVITTPADMTVVKQRGVKRNHRAGAMVPFTIAATDAVDGSVVATVIPASGGFFPLGATTVNVSATDAHGNESKRSFTVTVIKKNKRAR